MNNSPDSLPNISCLEMFLKNPTSSKLEVVQGVHKYLSDVIKGTEQSSTNSDFIDLFTQFTKAPFKDYVYRLMTKSILLEVSLCLVQELISGLPDRAANLNLVVEGTRAGQALCCDRTVCVIPSGLPILVRHR